MVCFINNDKIIIIKSHTILKEILSGIESLYCYKKVIQITLFRFLTSKPELPEIMMLYTENGTEYSTGLHKDLFPMSNKQQPGLSFLIF